MINETACFTGHRHLPPEKKHIVTSLVGRAIDEAFANGYRRFLCGGALGFDTIAALQVLEYRRDHPDAKLTLVIPCGDQAVRWSVKDRAVYQDILRQADEEIVLSPEYYKGCMLARNRYMVDHSSLCICYLYSLHGGTAYTVRYAGYRDIGIVNLAMDCSLSHMTMREDQCCSTFIFPSAGKNADIAHLHLLKDRNLRQKDTLNSF